MEQIPLTAARRDTQGKGFARRLRAQGRIPAVIYSAGHQAESLSVAVKDLDKVLRQVTGETAFLSLSIDEAPARMAVLRELQADYMGRKFLHVDFQEVKADQKLILEVPLEFVGEPKGANLGGILSTATHSIRVEGLVSDIPDSVTVDVSGLGLDEAIHLADLALPTGVRAVFEDNDLVVHCVEPSAAAEPGAAEPAEGAEAGE